MKKATIWDPSRPQWCVKPTKLLRQVHTEMASWRLVKQQMLQSSDRTAATHDQKAVCTYMSWIFVLSKGTWLALMHMKHTRFTHWSKPCMQAASMCKQEMHRQMPIHMKPTWPHYTQCIVNIDNIVNVDHIANVHNIVSVDNIMNIDRVMNIDKVWADLSSSTAPGQQKQSPAKITCWTPSPHGTPGPQRCATSPKKCQGHPRFSGWGAESARQATEAGGGKLQHQ